MDQALRNVCRDSTDPGPTCFGIGTGALRQPRIQSLVKAGVHSGGAACIGIGFDGHANFVNCICYCEPRVKPSGTPRTREDCYLGCGGRVAVDWRRSHLSNPSAGRALATRSEFLTARRGRENRLVANDGPPALRSWDGRYAFALE